METVCWICGHSERERRKQGCEPGRCPIPREMHRDPDRCLMNAATVETPPTPAGR